MSRKQRPKASQASLRGRRLIVISGLSGAGKSQALKVLEDFGFFCVDNLPVALIGPFADKFLRSSPDLKNVALGLDIRGGDLVKGLAGLREDLRRSGMHFGILFLEATEKTLVQRFSETRHRHPLGRNILRAIRGEKKLLTEVKALADKIVDTTEMTLGELKEVITSALETRQVRKVDLSVVSFGYKHGIPMDADIVMDVRFLPNPNYRPNLRDRSGLDAPVRRYIEKQAAAKTFLSRFTSLVRYLLPHYIREGKSYLTIGVGCTGGRHRSVFVANYLVSELRQRGYRAREFHRDLER